MSEDRKYSVFIAEDDADIVGVLRLYLENQGYEVRSAENGRKALEALSRQSADIGIFDIMMPEMNGYDLIREVRRTSDMPILVLSAKQEDADKIIGLDLGADDYLVKPFNPLEVVARVRAQLRRYYKMPGKAEQKEDASQLVSGRFRIDLQNFTFYKDEAPIDLTPTEMKILTCLMKQPGKVFTKIQLTKFLNGTYIGGDENSLMVHISKLRDKIEDDPRHPKYLVTVRGLGYKFNEEKK